MQEMEGRMQRSMQDMERRMQASMQQMQASLQHHVDESKGIDVGRLRQCAVEALCLHQQQLQGTAAATSGMRVLPRRSSDTVCAPLRDELARSPSRTPFVSSSALPHPVEGDGGGSRPGRADAAAPENEAAGVVSARAGFTPANGKAWISTCVCQYA
eukprot:GHVU01083492.1.p2 GENE.GHVU01083492.1~~GHVU01083492.1.p2  ORF type:complete len:157 (+),score=20.76 GHVU01083492.1:1-471(+)